MLINGDTAEVIWELEPEIADCIVTSPPYYALRDYGITPTKWPEVVFKLFGREIVVSEQTCCLGLENSPEEFIGHMVYIFRGCHRILKKEGTLWLNIGDSYWGGKGKSGQSYSAEYQKHRKVSKKSINGGASQIAGFGKMRPVDGKHSSIKSKDLIGIPWMLAFALREDGWYLRQDIIWNKPNPMPESTQDRCTKAHEYIFLLSKSPRYYFDAYAISTPLAEKTYTTFGSKLKGYGDNSGLIASENWAKSITEKKPKKWKTPDGWDTGKGSNGSFHKDGREKGKHYVRKEVDVKGGNQGEGKALKPKNWEKRKASGEPVRQGLEGPAAGVGNFDSDRANKRSVWTIATKAYREAHFATFPPELIEDCVKAGCPEGGVVFDPFLGAFTTNIVAEKLGRNGWGIEIKKEYYELGLRRRREELGLFAKEI
jgi:DNA modification methylase